MNAASNLINEGLDNGMISTVHGPFHMFANMQVMID
jgi:hypothetical protein